MSAESGKKIVKYLKEVCCHPGNCRDMQITAMCWDLTHAYEALLNTIWYPPREEKVSGSDNKMTGTLATPSTVTGTAVTPSPVTGVKKHNKV